MQREEDTDTETRALQPDKACTRATMLLISSSWKIDLDELELTNHSTRWKLFRWAQWLFNLEIQVYRKLLVIDQSFCTWNVSNTK